MKRIIKVIFIVVFFITIFLGSLILFKQPTDDILNNEMDCIIAIIMLGPVLILEIEIYSVFVYVLANEKHKVTTFFKITSLIMALLLFCFFMLLLYTTTNKIQTILLVNFLLYVSLKLVALMFQKKN